MRRNLSWFAFVLLLTAAFAIAQSAGQSSSTQQSTSGQSSAQSTPNQPESSTPAMQNPAQPSAQGTASTAGASGNDDQLSRQIKDQLASNPDFSNVSVTVESGRATLSGSVPNKADRNKARDMAKSVPGVKSVREHLAVSGAGGSAANGTMTNSTNPPAGSRSFVQSSGSATESTTNPSAGAGTQTGATAQSATGQSSQSPSSSSGTQPPASSTEPQSSPASPGTTPSPMPQSGQAPSSGSSTNATSLEQARGQIQSALQQQLPSAASGVTVAIDQTSGNQITLNGAVSTEQDKQRAEDVARSAAPGATIVNNLKVGSGGEKPPSDSGSSLPPSGAATSSSASSLPPTSSSATSSTTQPPSDVTSQPSTSGQSSAMPQSGEASANSQSSSPSGASSAAGSTSSSQGSTGAQPSTSGQSSTSQPSASGQGSLPQSEETADTATLQGQIQQALQNETTLTNDKVGVNVTDTEIELTGDVATNKDKQTAKRIAQSYAGNRKVVDHLKITGKSKGSSDNAGAQQPPL